MPAPAQTYVSLAASSEGAARAEPRAHPACRLHARVRWRRWCPLVSASCCGTSAGHVLPIVLRDNLSVAHLVDLQLLEVLRVVRRFPRHRKVVHDEAAGHQALDQLDTPSATGIGPAPCLPKPACELSVASLTRRSCRGTRSHWTGRRGSSSIVELERRMTGVRRTCTRPERLLFVTLNEVKGAISSMVPFAALRVTLFLSSSHRRPALRRSSPSPRCARSPPAESGSDPDR
jgi:hypothetical protein